MAFLAFFKFCPQNLWHFEDVLIKCPKQFLGLYWVHKRLCKKKSSLNFISLVGFQASKIWMCFFLAKFTAEQQVLKLFSGRSNSLEPPVFRFSNSLPYDLEESNSWEPSLVAFWVNRHWKMQQLSADNFFCVFEPPLWIYWLLWNTKFSFF